MNRNRLLILLICICALFSFISCEKTKKEIVTVSFNTQISSGNSMVKSSSNEILDIISQLTSIGSIALKNIESGKEYVVSTNETIELYEGYYDISYIDNSTLVYDTFYSTPPLLFHNHRVYISKEINVIDIQLYYDCYAIFIPIDGLKKVIYPGEFSNTHYLEVVNNYFVGFFSDGWTCLTLYHTDSDHKSFYLTTDGEDGSIQVEKGKYYIINTNFEDIESIFDINLQEMVEGTI